MVTSFKCPLSGQIISNESLRSQTRNNVHFFFYPIKLGSKVKNISLCETLFYRFNRTSDVEFKDEFQLIRPIIVYELINSDLKNLGGHIMHWDCKSAIDKPNHIILEGLYEKIKNKYGLPLSRKQKADNILKYVKNNQQQDGSSIRIINTIEVWGSLFLLNYEELLFYINELVGRNLLAINRLRNDVRLTLDGLDYLDSCDANLILNNMDNSISQEFDVALSFAGEQREYVEKVAGILHKEGINVFYDSYEQSNLWGKDLYQHLNDVYKNKSKYCIIFISQQYEEKLWTRHELKAAQARAFNENKEYILPVRFDKTELPGINPTLGYLEAKIFSPEEIAKMVIQKLNKNQGL